MIPPGLVAAQTRPPPATGQVKDGTPSDDAVPWGFTAPEEHGAAGNGSTDDTAALNTAFGQSLPVWISRHDYRITNTVNVPASCPGVWSWGGRVLFDHAHDRPALEIGSQATEANFADYRGLQVIAQSQSNWSNEASSGVRFWNNRTASIHIARVRGFTRGITARPQTGNGVRAFAYHLMQLGSIENSKIGFDLDSTSTSGWTNENIFFGGRFLVESGVNSSTGRIGILCRSTTQSYVRANNKAFIGPIFELGAAAASGEAVAWYQQHVYNEAVAAAYRDADVLMRRDGTADGTGSHGHYHLAWTGYSPGPLTSSDTDRVNGAAANRGMLLGLPNLMNAGAGANLTDYGGVIA
jgi:hypothetical protein